MREQGSGPRWPYKPTTAPRRQHWAAALILIVKRSRSQLFLSIRFCGATALTETIRWTHAWTHSRTSIHTHFTEGRGRERSKRGCASPLLILGTTSTIACGYAGESDEDGGQRMVRCTMGGGTRAHHTTVPEGTGCALLVAA